MKYKHIIFDLDGTLIDTESAVLISLREALKEICNKDYSQEELDFVLGIPGEIALQKLKINNIGLAKSVWQDKFKSHYSKVRLFPFIEEIIDKIKEKGIKVGIITSKTREEYNEDFLPFGLGDKINISLCIDEYIVPKPSSEGMALYLKKSELKPHEALYIGDTIYDYQCANGAGVDFGLAVWGCKRFDGIQANHFFNTPEEIINYSLSIDG